MHLGGGDREAKKKMATLCCQPSIHHYWTCVSRQIGKTGPSPAHQQTIISSGQPNFLSDSFPLELFIRFFFFSFSHDVTRAVLIPLNFDYFPSPSFDSFDCVSVCVCVCFSLRKPLAPSRSELSIHIKKNEEGTSRLQMPWLSIENEGEENDNEKKNSRPSSRWPLLLLAAITFIVGLKRNDENDGIESK